MLFIDDFDLILTLGYRGSFFTPNRRTLRADVCKYQPEVCKSEKLKILKKIHNIAHGKLLQEIHVYFDPIIILDVRR